LITSLFLLLAFALYYNALHGPFIGDSVPSIEKNAHIRLTQLSLKDLVRVGLAYYNNRPIAYISFALNYYFHHCDPFGYHVVNIIVHALASVWLFLFLTAIFETPCLQSSLQRPTLIAALCALLWLVHPVQTQSVSYVVQRMNSLAAFFFVLAFWLYVKGRLTNRGHQRRLWYTGAVITWLVSLGCKQTTVTLPFFILLYEWFFFEDLNVDWLKRKSVYFLGIVLLIVFMGLAFTNFDPFQSFSRLNDFSRNEFTLSERMMTQSRVVIYYISLLLYPLPSRLNLDYDFPLSHSLINPLSTLFSIVAVVGLIALGMYVARRNRLISFCIFWFFGNLAIESSVIPLAIIFEHRLYLPSMLFFLVPVVLAHRCLKRPRLWLALCCLASLLLLMATHQRNLVWENDLTLWTDVVAKSPNKARPHNNLGLAFARHGNPDAAITHYQKALQIDPEYSLAHLNWGVALTKLNQIDAAIEQFLLVLQMSPNDPEAHHYLGVAFFEKGMLQEAVAHNLEAVRLKPHFPEAYFKLGLFSAEGGKTEKAIGYYRQALRLKPDFAEAHINLGNLLAEGGKLQEAIWHYQRAKEYNPAMEAADLSLAQAYAKQGHSNKAIRTLQALLKLKPDFAEAHHALAMLLADGGDYDRAGTHYAKALDLDPDRAETHYNYGNLLAKQGGTAKAKEHYRAALAIDPSYADAHSNLGNILAMEGQMEEAIDQFLKALHHDPDLVAARSNLVKAYVLSGDHDAAMEQMEALKRLDPDEAALLQKLVTNQPQR